jgi:hypothetical protein
MKSSGDRADAWLQSAPGMTFLSDLLRCIASVRASSRRPRYARVRIGYLRQLVYRVAPLRYERQGRHWLTDEDVISGLRHLTVQWPKGLRGRAPRRVLLVWKRYLRERREL